jgi:hypothetical protein
MSGKDFSLIVPKVNTPLMNVFLEEVSKDLGSKEAIVVMDCVLDGISLEPLLFHGISK